MRTTAMIKATPWIMGRSLNVAESTSSWPMPDKENVTSTRNAPTISDPRTSPLMVTMGMSAFLSAYENRTRRGCV